MSGAHPERNRLEEELEITDLRPGRGAAGGNTSLPGLPRRGWQRTALGLGLALMVMLLLGGPLSLGEALLRDVASPTPTAGALSPALAAPYAAPTAPAGAADVPALGSAPRSCPGTPAVLTAESPERWRENPAVLTAAGAPTGSGAIGTGPVLVGTFVGSYATIATMPLGPVASANAYGWTAPYSLYGWPAPIALIVHAGVAGPVTLSGRDPRTDHPLWFGLVVPGQWGGPHHLTPTLSVDPTHPAIPPGDTGGAELVWYGYAFVPTAGCYALAASWPGGSWQFTISAGAVQAEH